MKHVFLIFGSVLNQLISTGGWMKVISYRRLYLYEHKMC